MARNDKTAPVFTGAAGIKNAVDRNDLGPNDLWSATNVDIGDQGLVSRRLGYGAAVVAGPLHSVRSFFNNTLTLGVRGTDLVIINPDWTVEVVRSGLTAGQRMVYVEFNDEIHYTNNEVIGFVKERRDGTFPAISKKYGARMLPGHMMEVLNGHLYVARGGHVQVSEPYDFGRTTPKSSWLWLPGYVTLLAAVGDGMYVASGTTAFLQGTRPKDFIYRDLADYDAIPHTATSFNGELVAGDQPISGNVVWWQSEQGQCMGLPGGMMFNIALRKYVAPQGNEGVSVVRENRKGTVQVLTILRS